jgi:Fe-S cluster biogenesis protein NfuA
VPVEVAAPPPEPVAAKAAAPPLPTPTPAATETAGDGPELNYDEVWELLDDMVRPALQGDGGDISLIKVEDNDVHVRLTGACSTCPSSIMTMKMGVEALLREEFPQMRELVQHDA